MPGSIILGIGIWAIGMAFCVITITGSFIDQICGLLRYATELRRLLFQGLGRILCCFMDLFLSFGVSPKLLGGLLGLFKSLTSLLAAFAVTEVIPDCGTETKRYDSTKTENFHDRVTPSA